jgi:hypothetical protein
MHLDEDPGRPTAGENESCHKCRGGDPPRLGIALLVSLLISACASPGYESRPWPPRPADRPAPVEEPIRPPLAEPSPPAPVPAPAPPAAPRQGRADVSALLPAGIAERAGWAADISIAFAALRIPASAPNLCAAIAVIEQESSFQADPVVPGLSRIAWQEIEARRKRYGVPSVVLDAALAKTSPDGRSYRARIDALRTEKQMSALFEDMIAEFPYGEHLFTRYNPVRTGGPMQVSIRFAEEQARGAPYPYPPAYNVRREVFTRRGGVYFGIAYLLDYPAPYEEPVYRFADFNAGRYSARNAAFQSALAKLARRRLSLDGDLLRYDAAAAQEPSQTERALDSIAPHLSMSRGEIRHDLALEKSAAFQDTLLYRRVFALADQLTPEKLPRAVLPQIDLKSPKFKRRLTTEWFAKRVNARYVACLERDAAKLNRVSHRPG